MRANKYAQNSDFLSLALVYKDTKNVTFEAQSVAPNATKITDKRVYAPLFAGSIDRFYTKVNGSSAMYGSIVQFYPETGDRRYCRVRFIFTMENDGYVKVRQVLLNETTSTWNVPQYNLEVFMQRFAPPDLF